MFRMSLRLEADEDGVSTGDWFELSLDAPPIDDGDEVPSLESLFFLDDLCGSLPRESCKDETSAPMILNHEANGRWRLPGSSEDCH